MPTLTIHETQEVEVISRMVNPDLNDGPCKFRATELRVRGDDSVLTINLFSDPERGEWFAPDQTAWAECNRERATLREIARRLYAELMARGAATQLPSDLMLEVYSAGVHK